MSEILTLEGTQSRVNIAIELPHDIYLDDCRLSVYFSGKRGGYTCEADYKRIDSKNGVLEAIVDTGKTGYGTVTYVLDVYVPDDLSPEGRLLKVIRGEVGYFTKDKRIANV